MKKTIKLGLNETILLISRVCFDRKYKWLDDNTLEIKDIGTAHLSYDTDKEGQYYHIIKGHNLIEEIENWLDDVRIIDTEKGAKEAKSWTKDAQKENGGIVK